MYGINGDVARSRFAAQSVHEVATPNSKFVRHGSLLLDASIVSWTVADGVDNPRRDCNACRSVACGAAVYQGIARIDANHSVGSLIRSADT